MQFNEACIFGRSQQLTRTRTRDVKFVAIFYSYRSVSWKQQWHAKWSWKRTQTVLYHRTRYAMLHFLKDLCPLHVRFQHFQPVARSSELRLTKTIDRRTLALNRRIQRIKIQRTYHYVKDATSLMLRRPIQAFLHSRATSPLNTRQPALCTNSY